MNETIPTWWCKSCDHFEFHKEGEEELVALRHYSEKHPEEFAINGAGE